MSGNFSFLDELQPNIKQQLALQIEKHSKPLFVKKIIDSMNFITLNEQQKVMIIEGFEPSVLAKESFESLIEQCIDIIVSITLIRILTIQTQEKSFQLNSFHVLKKTLEN